MGPGPRVHACVGVLRPPASGREVPLPRRRDTGHGDGFGVAGAARHVAPGATARQAVVREAPERQGVDIASEALDPVVVTQGANAVALPRQRRVDRCWP